MSAREFEDARRMKRPFMKRWVWLPTDHGGTVPVP